MPLKYASGTAIRNEADKPKVVAMLWKDGKLRITAIIIKSVKVLLNHQMKLKNLYTTKLKCLPCHQLKLTNLSMKKLNCLPFLQMKLTNLATMTFIQDTVCHMRLIVINLR